MSLRNSFYTVEAKKQDANSQQYEYDIRFNAMHPIFAGHFPGSPIVPGACLLQIAEELLSEQTGQIVRFTSVSNLKFRQPITPDMVVTFTIQQPSAQPLAIIQITTSTATHAQFKATYLRTNPDLQ